jgi:hypothetical protein
MPYEQTIAPRYASQDNAFPIELSQPRNMQCSQGSAAHSVQKRTSEPNDYDATYCTIVTPFPLNHFTRLLRCSVPHEEQALHD